VTVLFADVTGSTELGERLDPERFREVMDAYFDAMRGEIEAEGGTVEKFIGDAVMAAFGVPVAHEDDPARALRAARRMLSRLDLVNADLAATHGVTLRIRIGVNTGEVLATVDPRPGEPMVTGDAVNAAARLQSAAEPGEVVASERTALAVRGFRFEDLGSLELRGKAEGVRAFRVVGEPPLVQERGLPGLRAPMIGRDAELALLETIYERAAAEGRPSLVTIYGDAGVGKSRLTAEFVARVERWTPPPTVVRGRCLPYGDGVTYWPLAEILKATAGVLDSDPPELALEKIRKAGRELLTADVSPDPERATAALAYTVGLEDPGYAFSAMEPRRVRSEVLAAWRAFFSALADEAPVVAVIEDVHWADPAMLDLLEDLAERARGPAIFVCPARPELASNRPAWGGGTRNSSSISLEPLSAADADRLVGLLLSIEDFPARIHDRILERAEGNPFFLEEIIRHLIDRGLIARARERWVATTDIEDVEIPDTVQGVLAARVDLLGEREKRAIQFAAVVGRVFWPGPVGVLSGLDADGVLAALEELEQRDLVLSRLGSAVQGEPEFIFKHVLTRDVAYESLPRRERSRAHAAAADWIEAIAGGRRAEFAELLAYHYEEAYRSERDHVRREAARLEDLRSRAFETLLLASEDARRRYAARKATSLAERALALVDDPLRRARALEQVGIVAMNDYQGQVAWESLREAVELRVVHAPEDRLAIAHACARAVEIPLRWPGSMRDFPTEEEVQRYLDIGFASVGDEDGWAHAALLTAKAFAPFGFGRGRPFTESEHLEARDAGERAAAMARRLGLPALESAALDGVSSALIDMGLYGDAEPVVERRLQVMEELDDPWELGDGYAMASWNRALRGAYRDAARLAWVGDERTAAEAPGVAMHCLAWAALAEFQLGNWSAVVDDILPRAEGYLGERREDPPYFVAHLVGAAALIHEARGESDRARHWAAILQRNTEALRTGVLMPGLMAVWFAWVLSRRGDHDGARNLIEQLRARPNVALARPFLDQVAAVARADAGEWDDVTAFLESSRAFAERGDLLALPAHLDRLEGRAALAAGDPERAIEMLSAASAALDGLGARWERACTDLSLAEAHLAAGRPGEARATLDRAVPVFEELRSLLEIDRSRELLSRL
jgi:class 3 adenylate cyclase